MQLVWDTKDATIQRTKQLIDASVIGGNQLSPYVVSDDVRYFLGNNVNVMAHLLADGQKYDICYIDPPYNTRNKFKGYSDDFSIPVREIKKEYGTQKLDTTQEMERLHRQYLDMVYPAFMLIHELLSDDGVLFVSIDENELYDNKLLLDEIFGSECFIGQFNWRKTETPSNLSKTVKRSIEYILCYAKNKKQLRFQGIVKPKRSSNGLMNQTNKKHELIFPAYDTKTSLPDGTYKAGRYGTDKYDIRLLDDCTVANGEFVTPVRLFGKFKWQQETLDREIASGDTIVSIMSKAFSPSYIRISDARETPSNFIDKSVGVGTTEQATERLRNELGSVDFDYPKPVELIRYLLSFISKADMKILDCFAGSGTTGIACIENNEYNDTNWSCDLIDESTYSADIFKRRIGGISD